MNKKQTQKFWRNVKKTNDCWIWLGEKTEKGYGRIYVEGKKKRVHRLSYEMHVGKIKEGLFVCHKCDNRLCIKPSHLFEGTALDNNVDAIKKGRSRYLSGVDHPFHKFTKKQIIEVRTKYRKGGSSYRKIAKDYKTSYTAIKNIIKRKTYTDIT